MGLPLEGLFCYQRIHGTPYGSLSDGTDLLASQITSVAQRFCNQYCCRTLSCARNKRFAFMKKVYHDTLEMMNAHVDRGRSQSDGQTIYRIIRNPNQRALQGRFFFFRNFPLRLNGSCPTGCMNACSCGIISWSGFFVKNPSKTLGNRFKPAKACVLLFH